MEDFVLEPSQILSLLNEYINENYGKWDEDKFIHTFKWFPKSLTWAVDLSSRTPMNASNVAYQYVM